MEQSKKVPEHSPRKIKKNKVVALTAPTVSVAEVFARRKKLRRGNAEIKDPKFASINYNLAEKNSSNTLLESKLRSTKMKQLLLTAIDRYEAAQHYSVVQMWSDATAINSEVPLLNFVNADASTLTIKDVPRLLAEYKFLVKACAVLSVDCNNN